MINRIWIDVEDLFIYAGGGARPSGIQRLEFELCRALLALPQNRDRVFFVRHDAERQCLATIPWAEVETLFDSISNRNLQALPSSARKRKPKKGIRKFASKLFKRHRPRPRDTATDQLPGARPSDTLASLGCPWIRPDYFSYVERAVREKRLRLALLIYDIIPLRRPEWVDLENLKAFRGWFDRAVLLADAIFTISTATAEDVAEYATESALALRAIPTPIPIGTGFQKAARAQHSSRRSVSNRLPPPNSYALIVSTIEARKNHVLLFAVWRQLMEDVPPAKVPTLVFAGRTGWLISDLMQQLRNCNFLDGKIVHIESPSDEELEALYDGCLFTLFPSFYEGWGLPVSESLAFGRPCIISKATSLPEAGSSLARYIDPYSVTDAYRVIRETIEDQAGLLAWRDRVRREFRPVEWSESAHAIVRALDLLSDAAASVPRAAE
jgi:glycosyltransferase involved in cell wall biosynthesis